MLSTLTNLYLLGGKVKGEYNYMDYTKYVWYVEHAAMRWVHIYSLSTMS